jgi:hypothetical protein
MGLGKLNPGCKDECGCQGCFGSITQQGNCQINWTTSGDPFAVELRLGVDVVSNAESGSLYSPDSGTYTLWIKCGASDDWTLADTRAFSLPVGGCPSCCQTAGQMNNPFDTAIADVSFSGSLWSAFNGGYVLQKTTPCFPFSVCTYSTIRCTGPQIGQWPLGQPGNFVRINPTTFHCEKIPGANLYTNGTYVATFNVNYAFPIGLVTYEVWALPREVGCGVYHGDPTYKDGGNAFTSGQKQNMTLYAEVAIYEVQVSGRTAQSDRCYNHNHGSNPNKSWTATAFNYSLSCGNSTLSAPGNAFIQFGGADPRYPAIRPTSMSMSLFT